MPSLNTGNAILSNPIKVDSSYNVGIGGAASGSFKLQVTGTTNLTGALSGTSATFSGNVTAQGGYFYGQSTNSFVRLDNSVGTQIGYLNYADITFDSDGLRFYTGTGTSGSRTQKFFIASTGAATFSNQVTINGPSADWAAVIQNTNSTSGTSYGLKVKAGTSGASDATFVLQDYAGNEFFTARGNGRIGIGTNSPTNPLHIVSNTVSQLNVAALSGNTNAQINLEPTGTGVALIGPASAFPLTFRTDATERMRITSGGNVGIGTSSPLQTAANRTVLTINGTSSNVLNFGVGGNLSAYIYSDANDTGLYAQGNLYLQADGAKFTAFVNNGSERMRITSAGNVGIGTSSPSAKLDVASTYVSDTTTQVMFRDNTGGGLLFGGTGGAAKWLQAQDFSGAATYYNLLLNPRGGNVLIGTTSDSAGVRLKVAGGIIGCLDVYNNTTGVGANVNIDANGFFARSTSSIKYKKNVENYTKGLAEVMQMRPVTYNSINETETQTYAGLIAEEIHELGLTEFVQYAEDGTPDALSYSNMVSLLVKAIQEQQAQIEELKALIAAK